jgi:phage-related protein
MGLMIYDFGSNTQSQGSFATPTIVEDRISRRYNSLVYGATNNKSLEKTLVFGCDEGAIDKQEFLSRYDLNEIGNWLLGHDDYSWLEIDQPDMDIVRYKCIATDLKILEVGWQGVALSCTLTTDSPYAYMMPITYNYSTTTTSTQSIYSHHDNLGYYYPNIMTIILPSGVTNVSIINTSDNNREFKFTNLPNVSGLTLTLDNQNQIITANTGINAYQYFNFNFFRLKKGTNSITITGNSSISLTCGYPINIGG